MMSYSNKFAAAIKVHGKVLRENKEQVLVPFGAEYSMLLKNLNSKRVLVNVFIDGENHTPGGLVIAAGQEVDLERSLKNGSMTTGNRFKFIERTAGVEAHRGVKLEDGLVRIEFQYELSPVTYTPDTYWHNNRSIYDYKLGSFGRLGELTSTYSGGSLRSKGISGAVGDVSGAYLNSEVTRGITASGASASAQNAAPANEAGITVAGSKSDQAFVTTTMGALEAEKTVMIFRLAGETADNKPIAQPVTVKHKPVCTSCGKHNKANAKFCTECGTALEIYA